MMLPNSAIYEAVFEKYPSWDECVRAAFFPDPCPQVEHGTAAFESGTTSRALG